MGDKPIVLLDLNHCLAENSQQRWAVLKSGRSYDAWIAQETYRLWLVDLIRSRRVVMLTARPQQHQEATLARIQAVTGWAPEAAWFKTRDLTPPQLKDRMLLERVFPTYGQPDRTTYLALESNAQTRTMYKRHGISAFKVPEDGTTWPALPIPEPARLSLFS